MGWSSDGGSVLIHREIEATCNRMEMLEVWTVGADAPRECYDAYGEQPEVAVNCASIEGVDPNGALVPTPHPLEAPASFTAPALSLPSRSLLAWEAEDDEGNRSLALEILISDSRGGARFSPVAPAVIEDLGWLPADAVSLWPAPRGRRALVLREQAELADDVRVEVRWIKLPMPLDPSMLVTTPGRVVAAELPRVPELDHADDGAYHHAMRDLARARVYERANDLSEASRLLWVAVGRDPALIEAWLELARMLVIQELPEQGVELARKVTALPCPSCAVGILEQLSDVRFAPLAAMLDERGPVGSP